MLLAVAAVVAVLVIGSTGDTQRPGGATATPSGRLAGLALTPAKPAPALALRNYLGTPVNIDAYRGKAVLVTFLYTHCPDVCPLIASKLHTALGQMPAAERREVQIIAVSVDPRGDTRSAVAQFLADHEMTGRMQYLVGSRSMLGPVWVRWDVASKADESNPAVIDHSALIYGIDARGPIVTLYSASFAPADVVHDVRLLART